MWPEHGGLTVSPPMPPVRCMPDLSNTTPGSMKVWRDQLIIEYKTERSVTDMFTTFFGQSIRLFDICQRSAAESSSSVMRLTAQHLHIYPEHGALFCRGARLWRTFRAFQTANDWHPDLTSPVHVSRSGCCL